MNMTKEERPWGWFTTFAKNEQCTVKIIHVNAGQRLSRQYHKSRDELWISLDEGLMMELNDKVFHPKKGEQMFIPKGTIHRLGSEKGGKVLEVSFGTFDENDIIRLQDDYGRK